MGFWSWISSIFKKKPTPVVVVPPTPTLPPVNTGGQMVSKALLVGINAYPNSPLSGCVNDVANMANLLMQQYNYRPQDIILLKDREATTANILKYLEWLVDVPAGSRVMFHFSGHGTQTAHGGNDEPDGMSELICPVDFDWSQARMITDNQLVQFFQKIPAGCTFNWVSDSCHSGDLTRDMAVPTTFFKKLWYKLAFWKKTTPIISKAMPIPPSMVMKLAQAKRKGLKSRAMSGGVLEVGFISGCMSNQTSADTEMNGQPCGALTYFLVKKLKQMPNDSVKNVVAAVNVDLTAHGYTQRPQAEGTRIDRPFLLP